MIAIGSWLPVGSLSKTVPFFIWFTNQMDVCGYVCGERQAVKESGLVSDNILGTLTDCVEVKF
jgi:hypothetical protein